MPLINEGDRDCRHCRKRIRFLGRFVNAWVHVDSQSIWCDPGASIRATPI